MSQLRITMLVEPDAGEPLVGLLAKALGRGELGIADLRIERTRPLDEEHLSYAGGYAEGVAVKALVARGAKLMKAKLAQDAPRKAPDAPRTPGAKPGDASKPCTVDVTRGGARLIHDRLKAGPATWGELRKALTTPNSASSLIARMARANAIERGPDGAYRLKGATP